MRTIPRTKTERLLVIGGVIVATLMVLYFTLRRFDPEVQAQKQAVELIEDTRENVAKRNEDLKQLNDEKERLLREYNEADARGDRETADAIFRRLEAIPKSH